MAEDGRQVPQVIDLASRRPPLSPEAQALLSLLRAITDERLRRYCIEQIGAAETGDEMACAVALTRALGARSRGGIAQGGGPREVRAPGPRAPGGDRPGIAVGGAAPAAAGGGAPGSLNGPPGGVASDGEAAIGRDPGAAPRAVLRALRKRRVRCIATSSSP